MKQSTFTALSWCLVGFAILVPVLAWYDSRGWEVGELTIYAVFPLLGMWAWLLMWTHYVLGSTRLTVTGLKKPTAYAGLTGFLVLSFILLHPGLLAIKQYQLGLGTPPNSFFAYSGETLKMAVLLGSLALILFLSYDILNRLKNRPFIARNWRWVSLSQAIAMIVIFVHALRLGQHLQTGWMMTVWVLCGIVLIPCFYIILKADFASPATSA